METSIGSLLTSSRARPWSRKFKRSQDNCTQSPVVKLDGKAGWQGRKAGGMASVETGIRGCVWEQTSSVAGENSQPARKRGSLGGGVTEQVGEDHQPPPDSERSGHL